MDFTSQVISAIDGWLQNLAQHLLQPALQAAGGLLFQTPQYGSIPEVGHAWGLVRDVADGLVVLAVIAAGVMVMASGAFESRYSAKVLVPRPVLADLTANASLLVCGGLIRLDHALVSGVIGADPGPSTFGALAATIQGPHVADQVVGSLVGLAAAVLAILLVALFISRDLVLLVATVLAPLALATYALPQADDIARLWWRVFGALLFVQVIQAVLVEVGTQLLRHADWLGPMSDLTSGLVLITLLYLLFKSALCRSPVGVWPLPGPQPGGANGGFGGAADRRGGGLTWSRAKVPQHLEIEDVVAWDLSAVDLVCVVAGAALAWWLYAFIPLDLDIRIAAPAPPALAGLALGVVRIGDLPLRHRIVTALRYPMRPRRLLVGGE